MLNIIGTALGFIGSFITVFDILFNKPASKDERTWEYDMHADEREIKTRVLTIWGMIFISLGFLIQLIGAILDLK